MTTYVVKPGDSLSSIALNRFGSYDRYDILLKANPQIVNKDLIYVGQVINIPEERDYIKQQEMIQDAEVLESSIGGKTKWGNWIGWGVMGIAAALLGYEAWKQHKKNKGSKPKKK